MRSINDLWGDLGDLSDDELLHVITKLFAIYEAELLRAPDNEAVLRFFRHLGNAVSQTRDCNSNRR
jgi:hypothetical protein